MDEDVEGLKQHLPLLEYLQRHDWSGRRAGTRQEFVGLCPLHQETRPSFYVNVRKNLFYCHGCERGGDLIRFVEFFHDLSFHQRVLISSRNWHLSHTLRPFLSYWHKRPPSISSNSTDIGRRCTIWRAVDYTTLPLSKNSALVMLPAETYAAI